MRSLFVVPLLFSLSTAGCSKKNDPAPAPAPPPPSQAAAQPGSAAGPLASAPVSAAAKDATPAERPLSYDRKITASDLEGRTLRELALIRNMPYARAGKTFRKPWLSEYFRKQPWYKPTESFDESKLSPLDRENAQFAAEYEAKLGHDELEKRASVLRARTDAGSSTPDDALELQLLSIRLGKPVHTVEVAEARSPLEDPTSLERLLTVNELDALSRRDLRILRNTIYARRGRPFQSPIVASYFEGTDWYKPDPAYTDARLTAVDQKNIKLVRSVEDSLGGAMTDSEEAGWFGGA